MFINLMHLSHNQISLNSIINYWWNNWFEDIVSIYFLKAEKQLLKYFTLLLLESKFSNLGEPYSLAETNFCNQSRIHFAKILHKLRISINRNYLK